MNRTLLGALLVAAAACCAAAGCRKTVPAPQEGQPAPNTPAASKADRHAVTATEYSWKVGAPAVKLVGAQSGFGVLTSVSGNFQGYGEQVEVRPDKDGFWYLAGQSQQAALSARAVGVGGLTPAVVRAEVQQFTWGKGKPAVKMLHKGQGFCFLSSISGNFAGYGEEVGVRLADDGYWYLDGKSGQEQLGAKAVGVAWSAPGASAAEVKEYEWAVGKPPVRLVKQGEGVACLASVSGSLGGYDDEVRIHLGDDGYWYLSGKAADALRARALVIPVRGPQ